MELKTFSDAEFDPKTWINKAWGASGNQEKEVFVANTVSRLQLYMKQLTNSLDETTTQIVTSVPRILQDASSLQLEGALLQQRLLSLENKVQGVQEQTGNSIESLQRIDQLKSRLETAASALREADKWAALATELEAALEAGPPAPADLPRLARLASAMTASLEVLNEAPDYETKRVQLEALVSRLEAALAAPLASALAQGDGERTTSLISVYQSMGRSEAAVRAWRRHALGAAAARWGRRDTHTMGALTALLAEDGARQVDWLTNVLKTEAPLSEVIRLYTDLLLSLEPSPTKVASANLKLCSSPEEGINLLIDLRRDIDEFMAFVAGLMEAPRALKESVPTPTLRALSNAAHAPLRDLLPRYKELQQQVLLTLLDDDKLKMDDLLEHSQALQSCADRASGALKHAHDCSRRIGGLAAYPHYCGAKEALVQAFTTKLSSHSRCIETQFLSTPETQRTGVLSNTFPATLVLEIAAAVVLETLAERQKIEDEEVTTPSTPFLLEALQSEHKPKADPQNAISGLRRVKGQLRALARTILSHPVDVQLELIPQLSVWSNNDALSTDLPDFALSPQEYITEIGQYLMTLPQHLEMHLSDKQAPWQFLADVCTRTCDVYAEKILNIRNMDALGTKRCLTDIVYLSSVVEDLGTAVPPSLKSLERSLRAATPTAD